MSMGSWRTAAWLVAGLFALTAQAADRIEPDAVNRIVDEGFNRSELPQIASYLTDRIGARLTRLTSEQASYIGVTPEGPFKPEHYKY